MKFARCRSPPRRASLPGTSTEPFLLTTILRTLTAMDRILCTRSARWHSTLISVLQYPWNPARHATCLSVPVCLLIVKCPEICKISSSSLPVLWPYLLEIFLAFHLGSTRHGWQWPSLLRQYLQPFLHMTLATLPPPSGQSPPTFWVAEMRWLRWIWPFVDTFGTWKPESRWQVYHEFVVVPQVCVFSLKNGNTSTRL